MRPAMLFAPCPSHVKRETPWLGEALLDEYLRVRGGWATAEHGLGSTRFVVSPSHTSFIALNDLVIIRIAERGHCGRAHGLDGHPHGTFR